MSKEEMDQIAEYAIRNLWLVEFRTYQTFIQIISAKSKTEALRKSVKWWKTYDPEKFYTGDEHLLIAREVTQEDLDKYVRVIGGVKILY